MKIVAVAMHGRNDVGCMQLWACRAAGVRNVVTPNPHALRSLPPCSRPFVKMTSHAHLVGMRPGPPPLGIARTFQKRAGEKDVKNRIELVQ